MVWRRKLHLRSKVEEIRFQPIKGVRICKLGFERRRIWIDVHPSSPGHAATVGAWRGITPVHDLEKLWMI
jgi:hypothetical protein